MVVKKEQIKKKKREGRIYVAHVGLKLVSQLPWPPCTDPQRPAFCFLNLHATLYSASFRLHLLPFYHGLKVGVFEYTYMKL